MTDHERSKTHPQLFNVGLGVSLLAVLILAGGAISTRVRPESTPNLRHDLPAFHLIVAADVMPSNEGAIGRLTLRPVAATDDLHDGVLLSREMTRLIRDGRVLSLPTQWTSHVAIGTNVEVWAARPGRRPEALGRGVVLAVPDNGVVLGIGGEHVPAIVSHLHAQAEFVLVRTVDQALP